MRALEPGRRPLLFGAGMAFFAAHLLVEACVPDVRYEDDADGGASEAGARDGARDGIAPDVISCPVAPPAPANACCGEIPCVGDCSSTNCLECKANCKIDEICCGGKPGASGCKRPGQTCPL